MVFILALQGISSAPFRIVDEINQGLDSSNEMKVWGIEGLSDVAAVFRVLGWQ